MNKSEVEYKAVKSLKFEDKFIDDYLVVLNDAFHSNQNISFFENKYFNNIYGPSILVVAYYHNTPVGADALWRNDISGHIAYQSADTCVREGYRGLGIFKGLVTHKLSMVESGAFVYGFPNANSYPGFVKMGWNVISEYRTCLFTSISEYKKSHSRKIDINYARYWFASRRGYGVIKRGGVFLLVARRSKYPIYSVVGEMDQETSSLFKRIKGFSLLFYKAPNLKWYNKSRVPTRIITYNSNCEVPVWKMDSI